MLGASGDEAHPPCWLWKGVLLALTLALAGGLALSAAIGAGWNNPRPTIRPECGPRGPILLRIAAPAEQAVYLLGQPMGPFTLEAVATPLDSPDFNGYGLIFRIQEPDRYDVFAVGSDGYLVVLRMEEGRETSLLDWQPFPHVRRGRAANRLRLSCAEGVCRFWVNDEYVTSLPDDLGPHGDIGLWAYRFEGEEARVEFTQVTVWENSP